MSKILIEGNKIIIDGHANDLETCNVLTNLCDELSKSDKFKIVKYESGYGEFESVSDSEQKKFPPDAGSSVKFNIKSNDGSSVLYEGFYAASDLTITPTGVSWQSNDLEYEYIYIGSKIFLGLSNTPNTTVAKYTYGTVFIDEYDGGSDLSLYIVETGPYYQVNIQSNDGTATLVQNTAVDSVVVTSIGAQIKCGDTVNTMYTYSGSKMFAGLATSANALVAEYKPGDTIEITAETTFYVVENIIIPKRHSSLNELFTNIAAVIREKTGDTTSIIANDFPNMIRERLQMIPPSAPYLTFSSPSSFTLAINDATKHWDGILECSTDTSTWSIWDGTTTLSSAISGSDNVLYLRGTGNTVITGNNSSYRWVLTGSDIACIGNIENLLDYTMVKCRAHPTMANYCYSFMFYDCTRLTQAPELPATTLSSNCYQNMFYNCTGLTKAPELPATTLNNYCYNGMFRSCTNLTQAPELPATTLANHCYQNMFYDCDSLTQAPSVLPATTLASNCYQDMFYRCNSLTQAPSLPATTLATSCYKEMFSGCTNLTQAPELPATKLEKYCYDTMFSYCISLTQAPKLPATMLASYCYRNMFSRCTSLTQAPELPATTLLDNCYYEMFSDCSNLIQAPELPATTLDNYCYNGMFRSCTNLTQAPELPATTLANYCYYAMFNECTSLTKAPSELPATTLTDSCYRFMFEFTAITAIPRIMATTYATNSCKGMFDDVKTLNVYSSSGPGHEYGWTAPASTYCSGMFGSDNGESEWAKLDGSNFPNSGTPTNGVTYYFATVD